MWTGLSYLLAVLLSVLFAKYTFLSNQTFRWFFNEPWPDSIEEIFSDINPAILEKEHGDTPKAAPTGIAYYYFVCHACTILHIMLDL